ncbi:MAG: response regulator transcription factor [Desulfosudaceae bacterium]
MKPRILLIDDDQELRDLLSEYFHDNHLAMESALTGQEGAALAVAEDKYDIIVLDIMLPDMDGFETLKKIRAVSRIPVIMLTAREDQADRIIGLELGADDYMHKPFNPRELIARVKAVMRRVSTAGDDNLAEQSGKMFFGSMVIDFPRRKLSKAGKEIYLTGVETDILTELISRRGNPVTRDWLLNIVSGRNLEVFDRSIDVHISRIRKKIEDDPSAPRYIKTIWGKGYMWTV